MKKIGHLLYIILNIRNSLISIIVIVSACSSPLVITINEQAIYDPEGRLLIGGVSDADLQGCINLALQQQNKSDPSELTILSCANAEISNLDNIDTLPNLRFLDLGNNNLTKITPLEDLNVLGGVNLANNQIKDVGPLFNVPNLSSVNLSGNDNIDCGDLDSLQQKFGPNLSRPRTCSN